jgi:outer membrane protein OmpA-like peptidoglycan-associated protein
LENFWSTKDTTKVNNPSCPSWFFVSFVLLFFELNKLRQLTKVIRRLLLSLSLLYPAAGFSQNLLVNGSFEEENICIEYKVNCAPEIWFSSSDGFNNYFKEPGRAYEGNHCMAIQAGHYRKPFQRTFICTQLLCGLRKGNQYELELYVKSPHKILDSIGIYFTSTDPLLDNKLLHRITPSLWLINGTNGFARDSSWQKVVLSYTANGDEVYLGIGNFSKRDITGPTGIDKEAYFFVFIDAVSMTAMNKNEKICDDWQQVKQVLYDQDERHEFLRRSLKSQKVQPRQLRLTPNKVLSTDTILLPDVLFATGKKELQPSSYIVLDSFCRKMNGKIIDSLVIEGHTDSTGSVAFNEQLSVDRALSVRNYLQQCAYLAKTTVITRGWGWRKPVAGNKTPQGRQENRRVEMLFYIRE